MFDSQKFWGKKIKKKNRKKKKLKENNYASLDSFNLFLFIK